jgi:mono/diheme cytochrome c family protein
MTRSAWILLCLLVLYPQCGHAQPATSSLNDTQRLGQRLFTQSCLVCHTKPQITSGQYGPTLSRESLGGQEDVMRDVIANGTPRMPGFKYHFQPSEIAAIAAYLKTVPAPAQASPAPAPAAARGTAGMREAD